MAYGTIKVDQVTFTNSGVDQTITVSGIVESISGNITATGTIQAQTIIGTSTVSGATVTGVAGQFTTATITSGVFASGTAAAPSVSVGTTSNGIYSPGTNQLAISTNGVGRLFVGSSGNIGVGTNTPSRNVQVLTSSNTFQALTSSTTLDAGLLLGDTDSDSRGQVRYANAVDALLLYTAGSERLRITSDGKLGLGTSAPATTFHCIGSGLFIANTGSGTLNVVSSQNLSDAGNKIAFFGANRYEANEEMAYIRPLLISNNGGAGNVQLGHLAFGTSGTERLRITATGNVGVGTTSPDLRLTVQETATAAGINLLSSDGNPGGRIGTSGEATTTNGLVLNGNRENGSIQLQIASLERARIDSSGRLLVGTSSYSGTAKFLVQGGISQGGGVLGLQRSDVAAVNGSSIGFIEFSNNANNLGATLAAVADGTWSSGTSHPTRLVFSTTADGASSPTERMRISANGVTAFLSPGTVLTPSTLAAAGTTAALIYGRHSATTVSNGTQSFAVWSNGDVVNTNNSYGAISDVKLKENIVDANSQWDDLKALQVRNYNLKEGQTHTQIGLIAQEVELVSPGLVNESPDLDEDGNDLGTVTKSVNYSVLYMKAVKALQEAMERIETLEAKVAALESA